jgi:hypothetical protein
MDSDTVGHYIREFKVRETMRVFLGIKDVQCLGGGKGAGKEWDRVDT